MDGRSPVRRDWRRSGVQREPRSAQDLSQRQSRDDEAARKADEASDVKSRGRCRDQASVTIPHFERAAHLERREQLDCSRQAWIPRRRAL
jgi:hypothetical protein